MNKQQAKEQMEKLQAEMDKLKGIIEKPESMVWKPKFTEAYYCINGHMIDGLYWNGTEMDNGYYKTGKDASAFIMSMFTIPIKIAASLAGALTGFGLGLIGYEAEMKVTEQFAGNLMDIICYIPAGCGIIAILLMVFYSLTDKNMEKIMEANKVKRAETVA